MNSIIWYVSRVKTVHMQHMFATEDLLFVAISEILSTLLLITCYISESLPCLEAVTITSLFKEDIDFTFLPEVNHQVFKDVN